MTDDEIQRLHDEAAGGEHAYHSSLVAALAAEILTLRGQRAPRP